MRVWFAAFAAMIGVLGAQAAEKLPTDYGDPANDLASDSVEGLTWTGAARAYKIENDVVLVFTNTTVGNCSFTIADKKFATADYLLVGGGGAGGVGGGAGTWSPVSGGGGAGGGLNYATGVELTGSYVVTVGAGGKNGANGTESKIADDITAVGGLAASGTTGGATESHGGGTSSENGYGGGGAGAAQDGFSFDKTAASWKGGAGGAGSVFNITGEDICYAGGGAGGSTGYYGGDPDKSVSGGVGGGGGVLVDREEPDFASYAGIDSLGGGGGGAAARSFGGAYVVSAPGCGGNGVVIVRIKSISAERLPTGYGNPADDIESGSVASLTWTGAARAYKIENDVVLVFTNTATGECSFSLAGGKLAKADYLLVGGGGAGGQYYGSQWESLVGAGGGAGGMLEGSGLSLVYGTYAVTVGKGGRANPKTGSSAESGSSSLLTHGGVSLLEAFGGGAGGFVCGVATKASGANGGCGGGAAYSQQSGVASVSGTGFEGQGKDGGSTQANGSYAAGGGGAGVKGCDSNPSAWIGGDGGAGLASTITGEAVWYAGGGAGGSTGYFVDGSHDTEKTTFGGRGGGGKSTVVQDGDCIAENGVDTLGGGGAGSSIGKWSDVGSYIGTTAGNGGNGVVVIRITEIKDDDPLDGVSFSGQMEWFNIGEGKTRETVVVYKNVEAAGTLTLSRGVMARVLLVGGGGPGGNGQQTGAGGGGGAGGFVEANAVKLRSGTYTITVGKGGEPKYTGGKDFNNNGNPSVLSRGSKVVFKALGGGGGANTSSSEGAGWLYACGNPFGYCTTDGVNFDYTKCDVASGGGGTYMGGWYSGPQYGGKVVGDQGNNGGDCGKKVDGAFADWQTPGGGGGAGTAARRQENNWIGGAGGDGKLSDITGDAVYYAGGGAGGAGCYNEHKFIAGGVGGGGSAEMDNRAETLVGEPGNGVDGFGGGGAGSCYGYAGPGGNVTIAPGRGGNGVVIVRITEVLPQGLIVDVR